MNKMWLCINFWHKSLFWCNGAASLVVGAWSKTHNKIQQKLYTIKFCSYATNFACFINFWSAHHVSWRIWQLFLGYRGISIIRGKIVAISNQYIHKLHFFFYFFQNGIRVHESPDTNVNKGKNSNFFKHLDQAKPIQTPIQGGGGGGGASIIFRVS